MLKYNIVTCQPFVGWRNGVARHRPVNKVSAQPRWRHTSGNVTCVYVVARRRAVILSDCKGSGRRDVTVLLNNAMTVARRPLTQLGYISDTVHNDLQIPFVIEEIHRLSTSYHQSILGHNSRLVVEINNPPTVRRRLKKQWPSDLPQPANAKN
jgi:hypothetical protein